MHYFFSRHYHYLPTDLRSRLMILVRVFHIFNFDDVIARLVRRIDPVLPEVFYNKCWVASYYLYFYTLTEC
jgi:hypothetical protein